ncbi:MAG: hypothetical protein HRU71_07480 [Planctomycetia bacterium]|nr:MAG: hypothetical protein HRU71_07480 [Planctomycetia bacterium]RIK71315.1 MAG: hypothetical protein DCC66_01630 [Planctomycetota bacterium]
MSSGPGGHHDPSPGHDHGVGTAGGYGPLKVLPDGDLDLANQSLADALRKSFSILKLLMFVLVVVYFLSGFSTVQPNEVGVKLRYGRIVGASKDDMSQDPVLPPGWHWSWPYPFERFETVAVNERELPVEFMFQLSDDEKTGGIKGYKYGTLSPERDDYLITGDVNILHASLTIKYKVADAVAYLTNIKPAPDPTADVRSYPYRLYPEYTLLTSLVRDAVIETAAQRGALDIRGTKQNEFLEAVALRLLGKFREFEQAGLPLGLTLDPATGVLAPKTSTVEAILPPRQTQEVFDQVLSAQSQMAVAIKKAEAEAQSKLFQTAGPQYAALADQVNAEFELMLKLSSAGAAESGALKSELASLQSKTEQLLHASSGQVQEIIRNAEVRRDQIVKEAEGEFNQFMALLPEYLRNPDIFMSRMYDETFAAAMNNEKILKTFVPRTGDRFWLQIARPPLQKPEEKKKPGQETAKPFEVPKLIQ